MTLALAICSLLGNVVVAGAFTYMGRQHAKERQFLINSALSRTVQEFAVRQAATTPPSVGRDQDDNPDEMPEGLY